jgi:hypothetical protein
MSASDEIQILKESEEYVDLGFKVDGAVPTAGVEAVILPHPGRPLEADWDAAELVGGAWKILIGPNLAFGLYDIWVRHADNPEKTVRCARRAIRII